MSFLTNPYVVIPTIGLLIEIIVLALLLYGYWMKLKLKYIRHGTVMTLVIVIHLASVIAIMVPSLVLAVIPEYLLIHVSGVVSIISLVHVPIGTLAILLGAWFIISWRLQGVNGCFSRKKFMLPTMTLWFVSLILGITLYAVFYGSALLG